MRGYKKFLFKNNWHVFPCFFKKRLLNFKRTKWKKIKSRILYTNRQYKWHKKHLISSKTAKFWLNTIFLKKKIKLNFINLNKKFLIFIKNLKKFLAFRKSKKVKRFLRRRLLNFFKKHSYTKSKFFRKCFNLFFSDYTFPTLSHNYHMRSRFFFKNRLSMKISVLKYYYGCFNAKYFKKESFQALYTNNLACTFLKPELRIDILLWRLKIFSSPYLARFALQNNQIFLNIFSNVDKTFIKNYYKIYLRKGDLVSLPTFRYKYRKNFNQYVTNFYLPTIFELDYYTNNFSLLKSLFELNLKDISSVLKEPLSLYQFKNYIFK